MVVRPFDWRDLGLLRRMRNRGVCLDSRLALTRGPQAIQNALLDAFVPGAHPACTIVVRSDRPGGISGIGQLIMSNNHQQAQLAFISPKDALDNLAGLELLDGLAHAAGERGVQMLVADVDETDPYFEALRRVGFAVFARQRIWRLDGRLSAGQAGHREAWRRVTPSDRASIHVLYLNLVPGLVQQVEPPPTDNQQGLVLCEEGEALGYLDIHRGPNGIWTQPYFHPAAALSDELLAGVIQALDAPEGRPLYVCVRSYQGGLGGSLERLGLQPHADQAVMVKRLTALAARSVEHALPSLDGKQPEPTAPFASINNHPGSTKTSSP